ncbi:methyltransferase domain-containing protein [Nocardioides sp. TF02-7]|uniref:class I SAM-dependent methyltransferase n=1 Tax=Nocardioides sp. TF02-7 TaxID=2917724 RepID=UPI001F068030|nr:methyltransferase domain-containing protein [Nocardioides sp. TF02-7]UMG92667.1 methyltransferase domain-containing protein [Nocardioides sp. TF02-7]
MPRLQPPAFVVRTLARQLGGPSGRLGAVVARMLNKGNRPTITAAVDALDLGGRETVADIGFGGGYGLDLLLKAVPDGVVHGVEPSADMLTRAARNHHEELAVARLQLHEAAMQSLPLASGLLDGWISLNTIYFVDDLGPAFDELARVLAPTGRGVLGVADPAWLAAQPVARHGFTVRPVAEVVARLERSGLTVEQRQVTGSRPTAGAAPYHLLVCTTGRPA